MSETFEKLKALLEQKGSLTDEEIQQMIAESGEMTDSEMVWLSAEQHDRLERVGAEITVEQYLAATQTLESADPGSPEYQEAERIVHAFEGAA
jgi:hypothetical protein